MSFVFVGGECRAGYKHVAKTRDGVNTPNHIVTTPMQATYRSRLSSHRREKP